MKFTNKGWFIALVVAVLMIIPTIYSVCFLSAYWDPYHRLNDIPVALVNEDQTEPSENKGAQMVQKLKEHNILAFDEVDQNTAQQGLINKKYYAVITIPSDFTADLKSASTTDKTTAKIVYEPNQKTNYLASQFIGQIVKEVEKIVRSQFTQQLTGTLVGQLQAVPDKMQQLNNGITKLSNGADKLNSSYSQFYSGVTTAQNGAHSLQTGVAKLDDGIGQLQSGVTQLSNGVNAQLPTLISGTQKLQNGATTLAGGVQGYTVLMNTLTAMLINDATATQTKQMLALPVNFVYANFCPTLGAEFCNFLKVAPAEYQTKTVFQYVNYTGDQLVKGSQELQAGTTTLANSATQLTAVTTALQSIATATNQLKDGSSQLANGSATLASGLDALAVGAAKIQSEGIQPIANGLNTAENQIASSIDQSKESLKSTDGLADFAAAPTEIVKNDVNAVDKYGIAFAPFFLAISLWVGSLILFMVLFFDVNDRFKNCSRNAKHKVRRSLLYMAFAVAQGIVLGIILYYALGLDVTNWPLYLFSLALVALMFEAIIEFLIVQFGDVGKFIALIFLIIQIAASGGTFPIETVTNGYQVINPFLPMKYAIDLFRETIIAVDRVTFEPALIVVISLTIVFVTINLVSAFLRNCYNNSCEESGKDPIGRLHQKHHRTSK